MKKHYLGIISFLWLSASVANAQKLTLDQAIRIAQENSYYAQVAQYQYLASYWTYRSYKAALKPAVNLRGTLGNFQHVLQETATYDEKTERIETKSGNMNTMSNNMTLSIDQKIVATGGSVSLRSCLRRLDELDKKLTTWTSDPLLISYDQPIRKYNELKWQKKTAPLAYQIAQRKYLASMQDIAMSVTSLFFNVLRAQSNLKQSMATQAERDSMLVYAQRRLALGTTTKSQVLQLELSAINARVSVKEYQLDLDDKIYQFFSYLHVKDYEGAELVPPYYVPEVILSAEEVLAKALENTSHSLEKRSEMLSAEQDLALAKSNRGVQMSFSSQLGLNKKASTLHGAYINPQNDEVVSLSLSMPIFDWGVSRGKVKMAQARLDMVRTQQEQDELDYRQELSKKVFQFNMQPSQCRDALRAEEIANENYAIVRRRFEAGTVTVTDLNNAQQDLESARAKYISQLQTFWYDYYSLQKSTLYDWISGTDLSVDFESLTQ